MYQLKRVLLVGAAGAGALASLGGPALGQTALVEQPEAVATGEAPADVTVGEVVVTGTNIRGARPVGTPVTVVGSDALELSGRTLGDYLRELPSNFAGNIAQPDNAQNAADSSPSGSNLTGGQGLNLRGLGALSTLTLVNGRRVAASGQFGDFVDISNIPNIAVARVEVLQDGASAVYGSDAVAGVVNLILRRNFDGLETSLRVGSTSRGGGDELRLGVLGGRTWTGGGVTAGYEYQRRERISAADRDYNGGDFSPYGGVNWRRLNGRAGTQAVIFSTASAATNSPVAYVVPQGPGAGLTVASLTRVTDGVGPTYDLWENYDILPELDRHSLFATLDHRLTESVALYGDARYTRREANYDNGVPTIFNTVPSTNPAFIAGTTNAFGVRIDERPGYRDAEVDSYGAQLGLRFDVWRDWRADASVSYSREDQNRYTGGVVRDQNAKERLPGSAAFAPSSVVCALSGVTSANVGALPGGGTAAQRFCAGLNYATFNPYSTQALSDQVLDQIIGFEDLTYRSSLAQGTLRVDGSVFDMPAGPVRVALGADYRRESIDGDLRFNFRSIATRDVPYGETSRNVGALFAEANVPVVAPGDVGFLRRMTVSAAVRYENYQSDLGDFDSIDPRVGVDIEPFEGLRLHGSWSTAFHAPPLRYSYNGAQPVQGGNAAFALPQSYTAPCTTTAVRLNGNRPANQTANCYFNAIVVSGGAGPGLRPETAETLSVGFDYSPSFIPGLTLTTNYYRLEVEDRIVRIQSGALQNILNAFFTTGQSPYAGNIDLNPSLTTRQALFNDPRFLGTNPATAAALAPTDIAAIIYATQTNLAALETEGVDFAARYRFDTADWGAFDFGLQSTWVLAYRLKGAPDQPFVEAVNNYSTIANPVDLRVRGSADWTYGPLRAGATVNFVNDYACNSGCFVPNAAGVPVANVQPVRIESWTTLDLRASLDLGWLGEVGRNTTLSLSVVNATDEDPPFIDAATAINDSLPDRYDAANANILGRAVSLTLTRRW